MPPTDKQLRFLRGRAHGLKPVIQIGNHGLSGGVLAETRRALTDHELIKLRLPPADRAARDALVTRIGHIAVLFLANPKLSKYPLPDA